mmetsp:Transcript_4165/g.13254  ORF Transcript_4165/g.13254 Transcript_4165/m.13254 type:complete len:228 (-) Transcript_4165:1023-1706(-)
MGRTPNNSNALAVMYPSCGSVHDGGSPCASLKAMNSGRPAGTAGAANPAAHVRYVGTFMIQAVLYSVCWRLKTTASAALSTVKLKFPAEFDGHGKAYVETTVKSGSENTTLTLHSAITATAVGPRTTMVSNCAVPSIVAGHAGTIGRSAVPSDVWSTTSTTTIDWERSCTTSVSLKLAIPRTTSEVNCTGKDVALALEPMVTTCITSSAAATMSLSPRTARCMVSSW